MAKKYLKTKDLNGNEYLLDSQYQSTPVSKKHDPDTLIIPFHSFGVGTRLTFEKLEDDSEIYIGEEIAYRENSASITDFRKEGDKFIIEAEHNTKKEKKTEFVNKIVGKIDMDDCLSDEFFVDMLANVFTEQQLQNFLNKDDFEIILFDNLMYLKSENKAYRL